MHSMYMSLLITLKFYWVGKIIYQLICFAYELFIGNNILAINAVLVGIMDLMAWAMICETQRRMGRK